MNTALPRVSERDEAVWSLLDEEPHLSARDIAEHVGISKALAHQALNRLERAGLVQRDDLYAYPITWTVVGAPDDDPGRVELTERDARLVVHLLTWLVQRGHAGEPTEQLIARIERRLDECPS